MITLQCKELFTGKNWKDYENISNFKFKWIKKYTLQYLFWHPYPRPCYSPPLFLPPPHTPRQQQFFRCKLHEIIYILKKKTLWLCRCHGLRLRCDGTYIRCIGETDWVKTLKFATYGRTGEENLRVALLRVCHIIIWCLSIMSNYNVSACLSCLSVSLWCLTVMSNCRFCLYIRSVCRIFLSDCHI